MRRKARRGEESQGILSVPASFYLTTWTTMETTIDQLLLPAWRSPLRPVMRKERRTIEGQLEKIPGLSVGFLPHSSRAKHFVVHRDISLVLCNPVANGL